MADHFEDVWLPEVEDEFLALLEETRDIGADVGNQFRAFEHLVVRGLDPAWRPIDTVGSADLYVMFARHALLFFAVSGGRIAVVKWTTLGTPHDQALARNEAIERTRHLFP